MKNLIEEKMDVLGDRFYRLARSRFGGHIGITANEVSDMLSFVRQAFSDIYNEGFVAGAKIGHEHNDE